MSQAEAPPPIEWHRVDRARGTRRIIYFAAVLVTVGATFVGAAFSSRFSETGGHYVALGGACTMLVGLVLAVSSALQMVQEDCYCAVRADGILLHHDREHEVLLPWDDIKAIEASEDDRVVFELTEASTYRTSKNSREEWPVGTGARALAAHLTEVQKKATHGLLGNG